MVTELDIVLRIAAGMGFGALIGFERQWRARTAGLRTNTLVSLGAALFVIMGAYGFGGGSGDPFRVAAQVVTGVGFLGAGVIMKDGGGNIAGINTAATLWASAAVGALAGAGLFWVGAVGTGAIMVANVLLRPLAAYLDQRRVRLHREESTEVEYTFEVRCARENEVKVRADVFKAVHRADLTVQSISSTDLSEEQTLITAVVNSFMRDDHEIELSMADVVASPEVLSIRWTADDIDPHD